MTRFLSERENQVYLLNEKKQQMFCWKSPTIQIVKDGQVAIMANYCSDACPMFAYKDIDMIDPITSQIGQPPFPTQVTLHCSPDEFTFDADFFPSKESLPEKDTTPGRSASEFMSGK